MGVIPYSSNQPSDGTLYFFFCNRNALYELPLITIFIIAHGRSSFNYVYCTTSYLFGSLIQLTVVRCSVGKQIWSRASLRGSNKTYIAVFLTCYDSRLHSFLVDSFYLLIAFIKISNILLLCIYITLNQWHGQRDVKISKLFLWYLNCFVPCQPSHEVTACQWHILNNISLTKFVMYSLFIGVDCHNLNTN